jgi:hypothetical protein
MKYNFKVFALCTLVAHTSSGAVQSDRCARRRSGQFASKKTRVAELFSVRSRGTLSQPHVKTDRRKHVFDLDWLRNVACQNDEPSIGLAFQGMRFDPFPQLRDEGRRQSSQRIRLATCFL